MNLNEKNTGKEENKKFVDIDLPDTTYLLKELPLFKFEPFILVISLIAGVFLSFAGAIGLIENGAVFAWLIAVLILWGLFLWKYFCYLPRGNKVLFLKFFESSGVHLSVGKIKEDRQIHFDKKDEIPAAQITNPKKHFDINTGRPMLIGYAGYSENISMLDLLQKRFATQGAKELNNLMKSIWGSAWQAALGNIAKFRSKMQDPVLWIVIVLLLVSIVSVVLSFSMNSQMVEVTETMASLTKTLKSMKLVNMG